MASIPPPPRTIGPYVLEALLGKGGMAEVYRARREGAGTFEKVVALKRILPQYARNTTLVQRFHEEARIAGALTHGNIVPVIDFGDADGEHYLVMEWVDGLPLSSLLRQVAERGEYLPPEVVAHIVAEAAAGLHHAHTRDDATGRPLSIVHRDVSPQNILLARQGDVKISDFGIAKAADSVVRTEAGLKVGKLCYMAPEQARGDPLDARADVYALGIVLWECLAMRPLFPREDGAAALQGVLEPRHVPPSQVMASAPAELDAVVLRALAAAPADRTPDAGTLARDLRVYLHSVSPGFGQADLAAFLERTLPAPPAAPASERRAPTPHPRTRPTPAATLAAVAPPRTPSRAWALWLVLLVVLALGTAGIALVLRGQGAPAEAPPPVPQAAPTGGALGGIPVHVAPKTPAATTPPPGPNAPVSAPTGAADAPPAPR